MLKKIKYAKKITDNETISIAISTNNVFVRQTKIMIASLENAGCFVKLYILNVSLNDKELEDIRKAVPSNVQIVVIPINASNLGKLKISEKWPIEAWTRILIPELIEEETVIYLDVDTIVVDKLTSLTKEPISPIAGVLSTYYFRANLADKLPNAVNSGVLVMNKKELMAIDFSNKILKFARMNPEKLQMPDQDSINMVCRCCMKNIAPRFNAMNYFYSHTFRTISEYTKQGYYTKEDFRDALCKPAIIHFNGGPFARPWVEKGIKHPYYKIYRYYDKKFK
jgi:lipopolysaccharide biosynthesis glycosyltransferase